MPTPHRGANIEHIDDRCCSNNRATLRQGDVVTTNQTDWVFGAVVVPIEALYMVYNLALEAEYIGDRDQEALKLVSSILDPDNILRTAS